MKRLFPVRKLILILLFPIAILLINMASLFPEIVEKIYSRGFYRILSQAISLIAALLPFSLIEFVIIVLIPISIVLIISVVKKIIKAQSGRGSMIIGYFVNVIAIISVVYFSFVITFDINYQRLSFSKIAALDVHPSSVDELYDVCKALTKHANSLRHEVKEDSNGVMKLSNSIPETFISSSKGYTIESKIYPELGGMYSNPKGLVFSRIMTLMGFQGIHSPLTQEANINIEISDCMIPSTACHEMAHQRGFAREDEANYIAYLTCLKNPDVEFQYSGELLALIYSMNALYNEDRERFRELYKEYTPGIVRDLTADTKFWRKYQGPVEKISNTLNDAYIKANKQASGVKSYGRVVDLLIAQYRKTGPEGL